MAKLSGVFAPICTPFADDESLDLVSLRFNLERYAASRIKGYLALGSSGENKSLTEEEKLSVLETIIRNKGQGKVVMAGSANFLFPAMMAGAVGGTVSIANAFPSVALELYECGVARDQVRGPAIQESSQRINKVISGKHGVAGVKAAMNLAGLRGGIPRRPLLPLAAEEVKALRAALVDEGLL